MPDSASGRPVVEVCNLHRTSFNGNGISFTRYANPSADGKPFTMQCKRFISTDPSDLAVLVEIGPQIAFHQLRKYAGREVILKGR